MHPGTKYSVRRLSRVSFGKEGWKRLDLGKKEPFATATPKACSDSWMPQGMNHCCLKKPGQKLPPQTIQSLKEQGNP
jgi:hypothetical protein